MLKKIVLTGVIALSILTINAQAFTRGNLGFNLGVGVGFIGDLTPAAHFSGEIGVIPIAKAGTISFGANADVNVYDFTSVRTHLAVRAAFHLGFLKTKKFDLYAGIGSGIRLYDHVYAVPVYFDEFIGARILLKRRFGIFAEAGYGATSLKFGITWIL